MRIPLIYNREPLRHGRYYADLVLPRHPRFPETVDWRHVLRDTLRGGLDFLAEWPSRTGFGPWAVRIPLANMVKDIDHPPGDTHAKTDDLLS